MYIRKLKAKGEGKEHKGELTTQSFVGRRGRCQWTTIRRLVCVLSPLEV